MSDCSGHAAPVTVLKPTRDLREVFRVSSIEKAAIKSFAAIYGLAPGTYVRLAALGQLPPVPPAASPGPEVVTPLPPPAVNMGTNQAGELRVLESGEPYSIEVAVPPRIQAEIAESKLEDDPARAAYIERRTKELYGKGKTTRLAETLAAEEWENRGA